MLRVAVAEALDGIDAIRMVERPTPTPVSGQALIRVHAVGVGPWDIGFLSGSVPGVTVPFVAGFEVAGVVEAIGDRGDVKPGDRVYASLWPTGGGFADFALGSLERLAVMPERLTFEDAAALVISGGTAHEGLIERGRLHAGESALVTAAAGGVGTAAVQIAAASGARVLGLASSRNHDYLRRLGADRVFDYHEAGWPAQVLAAIPGGVDLLFDAVGRPLRDEALAAVRNGGRVISVVPPFGPLPRLERGITGEAFAAVVDRARLVALRQLVDSGALNAHLDTVLPLEQVRDALHRVESRHTRGKIVLRIRE